MWNNTKWLPFCLLLFSPKLFVFLLHFLNSKKWLFSNCGHLHYWKCTLFPTKWGQNFVIFLISCYNWSKSKKKGLNVCFFWVPPVSCLSFLKVEETLKIFFIKHHNFHCRSIIWTFQKLGLRKKRVLKLKDSVSLKLFKFECPKLIEKQTFNPFFFDFDKL